MVGYIGRGKFFRNLEKMGNWFLIKGIFRMFSAYDQIKGQGLYMGRGVYDFNNFIDGGRLSMQFSSFNDESQLLILCYMEYIADVYGPSSGVFDNIIYQINPGLTANFPFLAQFAVNFEEYELIQMVFEFYLIIDLVASFNSSGNTGIICMVTNYRADAQPFVNKEEMIQYHGGVSGRVTEKLVHGVECDPDKLADSVKFVRNKLLGPGGDIKTYDHGIF